MARLQMWLSLWNKMSDQSECHDWDFLIWTKCPICLNAATSFRLSLKCWDWRDRNGHKTGSDLQNAFRSPPKPVHSCCRLNAGKNYINQSRRLALFRPDHCAVTNAQASGGSREGYIRKGFFKPRQITAATQMHHNHCTRSERFCRYETQVSNLEIVSWCDTVSTKTRVCIPRNPPYSEYENLIGTAGMQHLKEMLKSVLLLMVCEHDEGELHTVCSKALSATSTARTLPQLL